MSTKCQKNEEKMTINAIQLMIGYDVIALKSDIDDQNLLLVTVHM
jgi:hypothetical protein